MIHPYLEKLENTRYGFFVKNYKLSFLIIILLIVYGSFAAYQIPKESSPDIKFGIVSITTAYPGANPLDIDSIITEKVEKEIKDLEGIDTYSSSSAVGFSSTTITLKNDVDVNDFIDEVKQKVDKINFPTDVKDPIVTELSTRNEVLFQMMLYAPKKDYSMNHLRSLAYDFADAIEGKGGIVDVSVGGSIGNSELSAGSAGSDSQYDVSILLNRGKIENLSLTLASVVQTIRAFNQNLPLGNHELADLVYDYRISGEKKDIAQLMEIPIQLPKGGFMKLGDIATIERSYANKNISYGGINNSADNHAVSLVIYKANRVNIFSTASSAKALIEETLEMPLFAGVNAAYTQDLSDIIVDDYKNLGSNGLQAVVLIFLVTWFFIGFRQSLIATLSMPIAFFITFIYLNANGSTLNFMTNFSLVLTFGMGIDTVIVIIEAAYEYMKKGFTPKAAVLIAMKNYVFPNISSSLCNMIVFLPMMLLPGIMGKFLSFIPITIFVTLLASTVLASTLNNALFAKVNKNLPYYYEDAETESSLTRDEQSLLLEMRQGKEVRGRELQPRSDRRVQGIADSYVRILQWTMQTKFRRVTTYMMPVVLLILSFIFLAPSIGFKLFPSGDNPSISIQIDGKQGTISESMQQYMTGLDHVFAALPEVKSYQIDSMQGSISIDVLLTKKETRDRNSFQVQDEIMQKIVYLREYGLKVESKVQAGGPPTGKAVGVKLTADDPDNLNALKRISLDFENFLRNLEGAINVSNSSSTNPGQFAFSFDDNKLAELGLTPSDVQFELYSALNGSNAGTITLEYEDRDIIVKYDSLDDAVSPDKLLDTPITTRYGPIKLGRVARYEVNQALSTIRRVDGDMVITVEADTALGVAPTAIQPKLEAFAASYAYPEGLGYKVAGENEANKELIQATFSALGLALFLVFAILVFEFNSFGKPLIILYSILTALLGANIGMYVTGNPYSMPFMIGFISLIGIVVNMAIFLVDRMNENINRGLAIEQAIIEAGTTRFKPVIISSITTIFGIIGLAFQDEFWAGLGFTVVFGLLFCAFITLFALPNLFYAAYGKRKGVVNE